MEAEPMWDLWTGDLLPSLSLFSIFNLFSLSPMSAESSLGHIWWFGGPDLQQQDLILLQGL